MNSWDFVPSTHDQAINSYPGQTWVIYEWINYTDLEINLQIHLIWMK